MNISRVSHLIARLRGWWTVKSGLHQDAYLYLTAAFFSFLMWIGAKEHAQSLWGEMSLLPYLAGAGSAVVASRLRPKVKDSLRFVVLVVVGLGVILAPLVVETTLRAHNLSGHYVQPEVRVIERSGSILLGLHDPYRSFIQNGHVVNEVSGVPAYESFFPYLPLMGIFGIPSAFVHHHGGFLDARWTMTAFSLVVLLIALKLLSADKMLKIRIAQVLLVLPTGALFVVTGGDDIPVLAGILLGAVLLKRRNNELAGFVLGLVAAMKLTAWPLTLGAPLVARKKDGKSARVILGSWATVTLAVIVTPFLLRAPHAFVVNVLEFPLGLAGVASPAASALPGHILTTLYKPLGHLLGPATFAIGGYFIFRWAHRNHPIRLEQLLRVFAVSVSVMMLASSATRIGYVIYPINLWLWARVLRD
jgi:hypothetical protein